MSDLLDFVGKHPKGVSAGEIERYLKLSRTTLNRRLKEALLAGSIAVTGKGPSTRYYSADPLLSIRVYLTKPHTEREMAPYQEVRLGSFPMLSADDGEQVCGCASVPTRQTRAWAVSG